MRDELFIFGDPRFLSGGDSRSGLVDYTSPPPRTAEPVRSADVAKARGAGIAERLAGLGQTIHGGKRGYHERPFVNLFLQKGCNPTAGVEIETVARRTDGGFCSKLERALRSNWFHAERDGSLDPDHGGDYGYEWITEPLPPRVYRDPRTWIGLQNLLVPWVESFNRKECGLHVHVGLEQFEDPDCLTFEPVQAPQDRRALGKYLSAFVYYAILDAAFIDRVVLRKATSYCAPSCPEMFREGFAPGMTAAEIVDGVIRSIYRADADAWNGSAEVARRRLRESGSCLPPDMRLSAASIGGFTGHGVEINCRHPYTVEFRRGKGTLQGISIHRMVELMTLIVRFAWRLARNPGLTVERGDIYRWIADNTTSAALKGMAEREICA